MRRGDGPRAEPEKFPPLSSRYAINHPRGNQSFNVVPCEISLPTNYATRVRRSLLANRRENEKNLEVRRTSNNFRHTFPISRISYPLSVFLNHSSELFRLELADSTYVLPRKVSQSLISELGRLIRRKVSANKEDRDWKSRATNSTTLRMLTLVSIIFCSWEGYVPARC